MPVTEPEKEEMPPFLGSWKWVYALVLGELLLCILLFRLFSWAYS
jgi:hypothetical protein